MIGIVLIGIRPFASSMLQALELVAGPQKDFVALDFDVNADGVEMQRNELIDRVTQVDTGDGVIIFSDMFGQMPSNVAVSIMRTPSIEVVAGVNLPMLVKAVSVRDEKIRNVVRQAEEAGRKYIYTASKFLTHDPPAKRRSSQNDEVTLRKAALGLATDTRSNLLKVEKLVEALSIQEAVTPGIGHNNPPVRMVIDPALLKEGVAAAELIEEELHAEKPRKKVIEVSLFVLGQVKNGVKELLKWLGRKVDKFLDSFLEATAKTAAPAAAAVVGAEAVLGRLSEDIEKLITVVHNLLKIVGL